MWKRTYGKRSLLWFTLMAFTIIMGGLFVVIVARRADAIEGRVLTNEEMAAIFGDATMKLPACQKSIQCKQAWLEGDAPCYKCSEADTSTRIVCCAVTPPSTKECDSGATQTQVCVDLPYCEASSPGTGCPPNCAGWGNFMLDCGIYDEKGGDKCDP